MLGKPGNSDNRVPRGVGIQIIVEGEEPEINGSKLEDNPTKQKSGE